MRLIVDVELLKALVDSAKEINIEPSIVIGENGLSIMVMDVSRAVLLHLGIRKQVFDYYEVSGKEEIICVGLEDISKCLAGTRGIATVYLDEDEMKLIMQIPSRYAFKEFKFPLFVPKEGSDLVPTGLPFTSFCKLTVDFLEETVRTAERMEAFHSYFEVNNDLLVIDEKGDRAIFSVKPLMGKGVLAKDLNEGDNVILLNKQLKDILNAGSKFSNIVKMSFTTELPVMFEFQVPFDGICTCWVAPCLLGDVEEVLKQRKRESEKKKKEEEEEE